MYVRLFPEQFFREEILVITDPDRFAIADAYLRAAEHIAERIVDEAVSAVVGFLQAAMQLIIPTTERTFAYGPRLRPEVFRPDPWLVHAYVHEADDLSHLTPACVRSLGLADQQQLAFYHPRNRFLVWSIWQPCSPFLRGHLTCHEGFHAWKHQAHGFVTKTHDWNHERESHQFEHTLVRRYGGDIYEGCLRRHMRAIHEQARRVRKRPGDTYFIGWPYDADLDIALGPAVSELDQRARMRVLNIHALFTIIEEDGSQPAGPWQTALLKFIYERT